MMRLFSLVALGILTGVLGSEDICRMDPGYNCKVHSLYPDPFPSNEEELQNACANVPTVKECMADYLKECSEYAKEEEHPNHMYRRHMDQDDSEREKNRIRRNIKEYQRMIEVTTEVCDENSEIHANFVADMACYREVLDKNDKDQMCRDYRSNGMKYLWSRMKRICEENKNEERRGPSKHFECMGTLLDMNCFVELFVKDCSPLAKDTVLELIARGGSLDDQCPVHTRLDILDWLEDLKSVTRGEIYVGELLKTESFF